MTSLLSVGEGSDGSGDEPSVIKESFSFNLFLNCCPCLDVSVGQWLKGHHRLGAVPAP